MSTTSTNSEDIVFNALSWYVHERQRNGTDPVTKKKDANYLIIEIFGRDEEGNLIHVVVDDYKPYFYIELPSSQFTENGISELLTTFSRKLPADYRSDLCIVDAFDNPCSEVIWRKKFHGYQFGEEKPFLPLYFTTDTARRKLASSLNSKEICCLDVFSDKDGAYYHQFTLYENNLEPILRFFHERDINPSGWMKVLAKKYRVVRKKSLATLNVEVSCKYIEACRERDVKTAPFTIMTFDIEASSAHGDFPLPKKNYMKFCKEIVSKALKHFASTKTLAFKTFAWIQYAFGYPISSKLDVADISLIYLECGNATTIKTMKPVLDENDSPKIGDDGKVVYKEMSFMESHIEPLQERVHQLLKGNIPGMKMLTKTDAKKAKDELIYALMKEMDALDFPKVAGDTVTQIGSVFSRYGEKEPYLKHIITLGGCCPLPGIVVEPCMTEVEVLLRWKALLMNETPDIICGYNTMGFDYKFLWERAQELKIVHEFQKLSKRNTEHKCKFIEKELVSAGLGENKLYFIDIPGSINIDLLKVVMRDHKLASYKLDDVASHFINGKVKSFTVSATSTTIVSDNVYALGVGDYVTFHDCKSLLNDAIFDGHKFEIIEVRGNAAETGPSFTISEVADFSVFDFPLSWGLKKDDVSVNDIFRLQNEGDAERGIIAKYCIQDCLLCTNLLMKLEIVANNMGMSSVCYTPLEYIFLRGQGIKTYSLVAYECRSNNYLIPFHRKEGGFARARSDGGEEDDSDVEKVYEFIETNEETLRGTESDDEDGGEEGVGAGGGGGSSGTKVWTDTAKVPSSKKASSSASIPQKEEITEGYEGACVLQPASKIYIKDTECITTLDFSSLYPSTMISCNLSHCSIILDEEYLGDEGLQKLTEMGITVKDIEYDNYIYRRKGKTVKKERNGEQPTKKCRFRQPNKDPVTNKIIDDDRGIIPRTLMKLLAKRKATRKLMITETDPFKWAVLEGLQLAYKVTANSLYGSIGAAVNPIYFKDIAACTTAGGRQHLFMARDFVLREYPGSKIVYGDSVSADTPICLRRVSTNEILICAISELEEMIYCVRKCIDKTEHCVSKVYYEVFDLETWSSRGWTPLHYIMKHRLSLTKKMYRVETESGFIDVTSDHSLLNENGVEIKPSDVQVGVTRLLRKRKPFSETCSGTLEEISPEECRLMGLFFLVGTSTENSWHLSISPYYLQEIIIPYIALCKKLYPELNLSIIPGLDSYEIQLTDRMDEDDVCCCCPSSCACFSEKDNHDPQMSCSFYKLLIKYRKNGDKKEVPMRYLQTQECREQFWKGVQDAAKSCKFNTFPSFVCGESTVTLCLEEPSVVAQLRWIAQSLDWQVRTYRVDPFSREMYFEASATETITFGNGELVLSVVELPDVHHFDQEIYVYDLTTENHHFAAGTGDTIVHNTDSIFIQFPLLDENGEELKGKAALQKSIDLGQDASSKFQQYLEPPHCLEYEKTFTPFILFSKKRYVGLKYEDDVVKFKHTSMGIVLKRRDNATILKHVYGKIVDCILYDHDIIKATHILREELGKLIAGEFPIEYFVISKCLKGSYDNPDAVVHKVLADRITERGEGKPQSNDRINYVYIDVGNTKVKLQGERVESPEFIKANKLKIDYEFYITHQLLKPISQIFALDVERLPQYRKSPEHFTRIQAELSAKIDDPEVVRKKMEALRVQEVKEILFDDFLKKIEMKRTGQSSLEKYFYRDSR
jgi:DNA polymerase elongation subunit (family B)